MCKSNAEHKREWERRNMPKGVSKSDPRPWEDWEDQYVKENQDMSIGAVADVLKRTPNAVSCRRSQLNNGRVNSYGNRSW